jgi:hypothetical protein
MRHLILSLILLSVVATDAMATEIVQVQFPQLPGFYSIASTCACNRSAPFRLSRKPLTVNHVWLHLAGTVNVGQYMCDSGIGPPTGPYPYPMEFVATIQDTVGGHPWMADDVSPGESGEFELAIPFKEIYGWPVTWDFLRGGHANIEFTAFPGMLLVDCPPLVWPDATITSAEVIVEGEFEIAVEQTTWGSIKALYR